MELTKQKEIVKTNIGDMQEFKITANAKAFDILSSGLYSNKIRAIVRELSTNAYDSHIEAGKKDVPFSVHLPNNLDPTFSVRDYGVGLSEEDVFNLYTTYFDSSKTSSNDFIGALGLGSKSPFSYTDSFVVKSFFNGTVSTYSCFLNESRIPQVAKLDEQETSEENGLYVELHVKEYDHYRFQSEASMMFRPYDPRPTISGVSDFKIFDFPSSIMESESWNVTSSDSSMWGNQVVVKYGKIEYTVDRYGLDGITNIPSSLRDFFQRLLQKNAIFIEVPLGVLDISASRESLSFDSRTAKNFISILSTVKKEIEDKIQETFNSEEDYMEAVRVFFSFRYLLDNMSFIHKATGKEINSTTMINSHSMIISEFGSQRTSVYERTSIMLQDIVSFQERNAVFIFDESKDEKENSKLRRTLTERAKRNVRQRNFKKILLFKDRVSLEEQLPGVEFPLASTLENLEKMKKTNSSFSTPSGYVWAEVPDLDVPDSFATRKDFEKSEIVELHKKGEIKLLSVFRNRKSVEWNGYSMEFKTFFKFFQQLKKENIFSEKVHLLVTRPSAAKDKKFSSLNLESAPDYIESVMVEIFKSTSFFIERDKYVGSLGYSSGYTLSILQVFSEYRKKYEKDIISEKLGVPDFLDSFDRFYLEESVDSDSRAESLQEIFDSYHNRPVSHIFEVRVRNIVSDELEIKTPQSVSEASLKNVVSKNWPLFGAAFSKVGSYFYTKNHSSFVEVLKNNGMADMIEDTVEYIHFTETKN